MLNGSKRRLTVLKYHCPTKNR